VQEGLRPVLRAGREVVLGYVCDCAVAEGAPGCDCGGQGGEEGQ